MSSIMRWRNGLTDASVMGLLLSWVRGKKPHILKQAPLISLATLLPGNISVPSTARAV